VEIVVKFPCCLAGVHLNWEVTLLLLVLVKKVALGLSFAQDQVKFLMAVITDSEPFQGEAVLEELQV